MAASLEAAVSRQLRLAQREAAAAERESLPPLAAAAAVAGGGGGGAVGVLDAHTVRKRAEQVWLGHNTIGYMRAERERLRGGARAAGTADPDPSARVAKRRWDATVRSWRRALHAYDLAALPPADIAPARIVGVVGLVEAAGGGGDAGDAGGDAGDAGDGDAGAGGGGGGGGGAASAAGSVPAAPAASSGVYRLADGSCVAGDMDADGCAFVAAALRER